MKLLFEDCVKINDLLYFICKDYNVLCNLNVKTGEFKIVDSIPEGSILSARLGAKIIYYKDYLYFAPMKASKIWRYNLLNGEWKGYERKKLENWTEQGDMFQAILYNEKIFFIGSCYPAIIVMNLKDESLNYITSPYKNRLKIAKEKNDGWFRTDYVEIGADIYLASCIDNNVLRFNLENYSFEYIEVGVHSDCYSGIAFDGNKFYLSPRKGGNVTVWDEKETEKIELPIIAGQGGNIFGGCISKGDEIIFYATFSRNSVLLDKSKSIKELNKQYLMYKKLDGGVYVNLSSDGELEIVEDNKRKIFISEIADSILRDYLNAKQISKLYEINIQENEVQNLDTFLKVI